jgi:hypothetical protein
MQTQGFLIELIKCNVKRKKSLVSLIKRKLSFSCRLITFLCSEFYEFEINRIAEKSNWS